MLEAQHWVLELQAPERNVDPLSFTRKLGQSALLEGCLLGLIAASLPLPLSTIASKPNRFRQLEPGLRICRISKLPYASPPPTSSCASQKCSANRRLSPSLSSSLAKALPRFPSPIGPPSQTWLPNTAPRWDYLAWTRKLSPTCVAPAAAMNSARRLRITTRPKASEEYRARATWTIPWNSNWLSTPSCRAWPAKAAPGPHQSR